MDDFERSFTTDAEIALARHILANVPADNFSEWQLLDIGKRARHWVLAAYLEYLRRSFQPTEAERHEELYPGPPDPPGGG
jgi:hypothetical protein